MVVEMVVEMVVVVVAVVVVVVVVAVVVVVGMSSSNCYSIVLSEMTAGMVDDVEERKWERGNR